MRKRARGVTDQRRFHHPRMGRRHRIRHRCVPAYAHARCAVL